MAFMVQLEATKIMAIEDPLAREEPLFFPPVLHMGKLIPSDLEQDACLNKVYFAARYNPEGSAMFKV
jgi:hypothetical protein